MAIWCPPAVQFWPVLAILSQIYALFCVQALVVRWCTKFDKYQACEVVPKLYPDWHCPQSLFLSVSQEVLINGLEKNSNFGWFQTLWTLLCWFQIIQIHGTLKSSQNEKKISKANKHRHITPKHRISDFLPADSFAVTKLTKWVAACLCHTFGSSLVKVAHYNSRSIPSASPVHLFDKSPALHSTYRTPLSSAASSLHETWMPEFFIGTLGE